MNMLGRRKLRLVMIAVVLAVMMTLALTSVASACPPSGGYWYHVVRGDTWYGVSRKTGVSVGALMNANPSLVRWNRWLYVCDWMWVPCPPRPAGYWYHVVPGDTWYAVSRKTGVSVWALMNANPSLIRWNQWLYVCDRMWIPN
ncbi:MAG: LysM peptidoglycan-binding domain-containing protein [Chloroflexi bacterium]|nr:LysM peptidoglycan-binding domain-containing protein [Chloroflexota bacterium]